MCLFGWPGINWRGWGDGLCSCATGWTTGDWAWSTGKRGHTACAGESAHQLIDFFQTDVQWNISLERSSNPGHNQILIFLLWLHGQHPHRKEERCFVPYKAPPEDGSAAEVEEFLEHAKFITEDLEWLLSLPHDKFWCQVSACQSVNSVIGNFNILSFLLSTTLRCFASTRLYLMNPCRDVWIRTCVTLLAAWTWQPCPPPRQWQTCSALFTKPCS